MMFGLSDDQLAVVADAASNLSLEKRSYSSERLAARLQQRGRGQHRISDSTDLSIFEGGSSSFPRHGRLSSAEVLKTLQLWSYKPAFAVPVAEIARW